MKLTVVIVLFFFFSCRFGDEGCRDFCKGLEQNITLLSLSMCYCDLTPKSGEYIGDLVSKTAVR